MGSNGDEKKQLSVTIDLGDAKGTIERLLLKESGPVKLRLSYAVQGQARSLDLTENDLVVLLQKAIRAGVLSPDFIKNLQSAFEI